MYGIGLESKAGHFQQLLLEAWKDLSKEDVVAIARIGAWRAEEYRPGCKVVFRLLTDVVRSLAREEHREFTSWIQTNVNTHVAHHMGWLVRLGQGGLRIFKRSVHKDASLQLTANEKSRFTLCKYTSAFDDKLRKMHKDFALVIATDIAKDVSDLSSLLDQHHYHDAWRLRSHTIAVRQYAGMTRATGGKSTVEEYVKVCPDVNRYLVALAQKFQVETVRALAQKLHYNKDIFYLSADCCFNGWLRKWTLDSSSRDQIKRYRKAHQRRWMGRVLHPHPVVVCRAVFAESPS